MRSASVVTQLAVMFGWSLVVKGGFPKHGSSPPNFVQNGSPYDTLCHINFNAKSSETIRASISI